MSDPRRQLIGRRSKAAGETFERWISNACDFYLRNGLYGDITKKKDSRTIKVFCVMVAVLCLRQSIRIQTESIRMLLQIPNGKALISIRSLGLIVM